MNQVAIDKILREDSYTKNCFLGVFARDELPKEVPYPACFVFNTDKRSRPGEHWLALHYDTYGNSYFFDSYGNPPSKFGLDKYLEKTSKKVLNRFEVSRTCNQMCFSQSNSIKGVCQRDQYTCI